VYKDDV